MPKSKQPPVSRHLDPLVTVLFDRNATVAWVHVWIEGKLVEATGSAKREPGDVCNTDIAVNLAVGRAFTNLGHKMQGNGHKLVAEATQLTALTDPSSAVFTPIN